MRANRFQADSRNRFSKWLEWRESERRRKAPVNRTVYKLLEANEIARDLNLPIGQIQSAGFGEAVFRPLRWLYRRRDQDKVGDVWDRAVRLAGGVEHITAKHTLQARKDWDREMHGGDSPTPAKQDARARRVGKWRTQHYDIKQRFQSLANDAISDTDARHEYNQLLKELDGIVGETDSKVRESGA